MPLHLLADATVSTGFIVVAILCMTAMAVVILTGLFARGVRYKVQTPEPSSLESDRFLHTLEALTDSKVNRATSLEVLTNGENFYRAELEVIRGAERSVNLEAYIFSRGEVARQYVEALTEKARAGVRVNLLLDALGSAGVSDGAFASLTEAGGHLSWYHDFRFANLVRLNNRSHRELLIVDGRIGFIGGAGIADQWLKGAKGNPSWRDTMVRVEGDAVPNLQATFAENWLESAGEILTGDEYFPKIGPAQSGNSVLVVNSTPSGGGSTRARILIQLLIASARRSIQITTPYFLPDSSMIEALLTAMRERGVDLNILVPGAHSDHMLTRSSSRRSYGRLLHAGARIFEYQPAMIHAKVLIIDRKWGVVGSTNFDYRSFGLNDEVNLAACDPEFAERLEQDFRRDLANSKEITYQHWAHRPLVERAPELLGWVFERQQ
jgi:cardiolipin synthase A/B